MTALVNVLWRYRGFVLSSIANEYRSKYARSKFGLAWMVLNPLAQVLIFATILSNVLAARLPGVESSFGYAAYLMVGILCWTLFTDIVQRCLTIFIDSASMLKKVQFPRITLPCIAIGAVVVANAVLAIIILIILSVLGFRPSLNLLYLPLLMGVTIAMGAGLGLIAGTLNVFFRDFGQVVPILLQFWFWMTPVIYPAAIVPDAVKPWLSINPMYPIVSSFQNIFIFGKPPADGLWISSVIAAGLLMASLLLFRRASADMVDVL